MHFEYFPTEIVTHVFSSCSSVFDVISLSQTCRRFHSIFSGTQKLPILHRAAEEQFGPLEDLTQLLTHNASQKAHIIREVPFSLALLQQMVRAGRVADKWCEIYPLRKWKYNFEDRRLLTGLERYRLRRALYRLWLYCRAFHTRSHPRELRMHRSLILERAALLHNWSTGELAEIADVHSVLRDVVRSNICPSNGTIARKFKKRFSADASDLVFNLTNIHLNYPPPPSATASPFSASGYHNPNPLPSPLLDDGFYHSPLALAAKSKFQYSRYPASTLCGFEAGAEGWGDDVQQYYVVEDMLKLDPEQILWLKENAPLKGHVQAYVRGLGDWFENNGDTWGQTVEWVLRERGDSDIGELLEGVREGELGIVVTEE